MSTTPPPRWRRVLRVLWLGLVVVVVAGVLVDRWDEVAGSLADARPGWLVVSALLALAGVGASGAMWRTLLAGLGSPLPLAAGARVFFVGQLGKYLPGSIWPLLAQTELARDHSVPARASFAAVALFMWTHLLTGAAVAAVGLSASGVVPWPVALLALPAVALLAPRLLSAVLSGGLRMVRREPLAATPGGRAMTAAGAWALLMWGCYGLHLMVAATAIGAGAPAALAAGTFAAAWCAGFLFVIAPAGVGVREAVMAGLLLPAMPAGPALAATLVSRLFVTVADVAWGLAGLGVTRRPREP